jgi:hypothetical protein
MPTPESSPAVDAQLLAELVKRAQADGVSLTGEGGCCAVVLLYLCAVLLASETEVRSAP